MARLKAQIPKSNLSSDVDNGDKVHRNYFTMTVKSDSSSSETWYSDFEDNCDFQGKSHPDGLSNLHLLDIAVILNLFVT